MQTVAAGLTELTEDELKKLLRHIYREELPCPVSADTLACVGFQSRHEWISAALGGLDAAGVKGVLVAVIAERRKAAEATRRDLPPAARHPRTRPSLPPGPRLGASRRAPWLGWGRPLPRSAASGKMGA